MTETLEKTDTITLPYSVELLNGMYSTALHAEKSTGATPIIQAVQVNRTKLIATNRYTVAEYTHSVTESDDGVTVLIPRSAAEWLAKQTPKLLGIDKVQLLDGDDSVFVVECAPDHVAIAYRESRTVLTITRFDPVTGNFPPGARLFPDESGWPKDPAPVLLNPALVELFTKGATKLLGKDRPFRVTVYDDKKPVLIEFPGVGIRGLIQPIKQAR